MIYHRDIQTFFTEGQIWWSEHVWDPTFCLTVFEGFKNKCKLNFIANYTFNFVTLMTNLNRYLPKACFLLFFFCPLSDPSNGDQSLLRTLPAVVYRIGWSVADSGRRTWFLPTGLAAHPPPTEPEILATHITGESRTWKHWFYDYISFYILNFILLCLSFFQYKNIKILLWSREI